MLYGNVIRWNVKYVARNTPWLLIVS
jgi:hypothetical protein